MSDLNKEIIENYDRLTPEDTFQFECHPGVSCFGRCCHDVNIFLTPYCVFRLKNRLGISSEEFMAKYTLSPPVTDKQKIPILVLKMSDEEGFPCQFLKDGGCSVYEDRPWACRMYPIGVASQKTESNQEGEEFYFLLKEEEKCKGHQEKKEWTIGQYLENQGVKPYDDMSEAFKEITLHPFFNHSANNLLPQQVQMFYMAAYNLDMFKRFLFDSKFFDIMDTPEGTKEKIQDDEEELLKFAFTWLKFSMFGDGPLKVKDDVVKAKQSELFPKKGKE